MDRYAKHAIGGCVGARVYTRLLDTQAIEGTYTRHPFHALEHNSQRTFGIQSVGLNEPSQMFRCEGVVRHVANRAHADLRHGLHDFVVFVIDAAQPAVAFVHAVRISPGIG